MGRIPQHPAIIASYQRPPEWRMNPVTGEWVIVAPQRSARPMMPDRPRVQQEQTAVEPCPFCEGNEERTPVEIEAFRKEGSLPNKPGWQVRTVLNSFPAVKTDQLQSIHQSQGAAEANLRDNFFQCEAGIGRHELIIECPQHEANLARMKIEQVRAVVRMWRARMLEMGRDLTIKYAQLFKNHGGKAGASVEHAHSQIIATPKVPITICNELAFAGSYLENKGACVYCDLLRHERRCRVRFIAENPGFAAVAAYAGRHPFETWIVPTEHRSQFEQISVSEINDLATLLLEVLRKMDVALSGPAYNLVFHTSPFHLPGLGYYHWRLEILPRLTQMAGFEWGSGAHINPVTPEDAALVLREI